MLDSRINQNFNRSIVSPQFRASQNVSKPTKAEEKQGMSTTAKWAIVLGLTALASYGIYAFTKCRVKGVTPKPENPIPEIKEMTIDVFKKDGRFEKGKAILKAKNGSYTIGYTGNITSTGKDGSKVVMEYVDGVLQKSTKTAKDGTKIFDKTYSYIYDGKVPYLNGVKKNGETILDENKLIEIYKQANTKLIQDEHNALAVKYPNLIKNLEEIYADINKIGDVDFKNNIEEFIKSVLNTYGYVIKNNKIIKKGNPTKIIKEGLIELTTQNKNLQIELKDIIRFLQKMNKYVDDPKINKQTNELSKKIIKTVEDLGYRFEKFDPKKYKGLYEAETGMVDKVELVRRAIVDKEGKTIAKGKVYLPENF